MLDVKRARKQHWRLDFWSQKVASPEIKKNETYHGKAFTRLLLVPYYRCLYLQLYTIVHGSWCISLALSTDSEYWVVGTNSKVLLLLSSSCVIDH